MVKIDWKNNSIQWGIIISKYDTKKMSGESINTLHMRTQEATDDKNFPQSKKKPAVDIQVCLHSLK